MIKATVFIPTYNGETYLSDILEMVFKQKIDDDYEVLIIDSGSTDNTLNIIHKYQKTHKNLRFEEINNTDFGHGKTRNYAATISKGEFVVYLSHDAIPAHDRWLYEMIKPFELNPKIAGVIGKQSPRPKCVPLLKYEIQAVFRGLGPDFGTTLYYQDDFVKTASDFDAISFYSDVNSAVKRDFLLGSIPYRDVPYAEDQMFGKDIIEGGYYKAYAARGSVVHSNDLLLREYKHRIFDEIVGLREIGTVISKPSIKTITKLIFVGILKDSVKTVLDSQYSFKRKLYWLILNPFYHIEKWHGVRLATSVKLDDRKMFDKLSLEKRRNKDL